MAYKQCNGCKEYKEHPRSSSKYCSRLCWKTNWKPYNFGKSSGMKGRTHSLETKNKISDTNTTNGAGNYRVKFLAEVDIIACEKCSSESHIVIHHMDENRKNNKLDNLQMICRSCHAKEHNLGRFLPSDGGWSKRTNIIGGEKNV